MCGQTADPTAADRSPKTIVITRASDGVGAAAARSLRSAGHAVVVVGRSPAKTRQVAKELGSDHSVVDFARLTEVRHLAAEIDKTYPRIDVLANNAGGVFDRQHRTVDGFESTLQINHLAPFLLTNLLLPKLLESRTSVIQTASRRCSPKSHGLQRCEVGSGAVGAQCRAGRPLTLSSAP